MVLVEAGRMDEARAQLHELERRLGYKLTMESRLLRAPWYSPTKAQALLARRHAAALKLGIAGASEAAVR
jgi:hypothetical protein